MFGRHRKYGGFARVTNKRQYNGRGIRKTATKALPQETITKLKQSPTALNCGIGIRFSNTGDLQGLLAEKTACFGWILCKGYVTLQGLQTKRRTTSVLSELIPLFLKRRLPTLPLLRSTIGVARLNFSVRNGKRWNPCAITTLISFWLSTHRKCNLKLLKDFSSLLYKSFLSLYFLKSLLNSKFINHFLTIKVSGY